MTNNTESIQKLKNHQFNTNKVEHYVDNTAIFVKEFLNLKKIIELCSKIDKKFQNMSIADEAIYIFLNSKLTTLPQNMKIKVINTIYKLSLQQISLVINKLKKNEAGKKNIKATNALRHIAKTNAIITASKNPVCRLLWK